MKIKASLMRCFFRAIKREETMIILSIIGFLLICEAFNQMEDFY